MVKIMCPSYNLLHETQFTILMRERYEFLRLLVKKKIREAKHVYLTTDIWSDMNMRGYLGVTCHFYDEGKWFITFLKMLDYCCRNIQFYYLTFTSRFRENNH